MGRGEVRRRARGLECGRVGGLGSSDSGRPVVSLRDERREEEEGEEEDGTRRSKVGELLD